MTENVTKDTTVPLEAVIRSRIVPEEYRDAEYVAFQRAGGSLSRYHYGEVMTFLEKLQSMEEDEIVKTCKGIVGKDKYAQTCFATYCRNVDAMLLQEALFCQLRKYMELIMPPDDDVHPRSRRHHWSTRDIMSIGENLTDQQLFNDVLLLTGLCDESIEFMRANWNIFRRKFAKPEEYIDQKNPFLNREERICIKSDEELQKRMQEVVTSYIK
jgi:hypothetical protein